MTDVNIIATNDTDENNQAVDPSLYGDSTSLVRITQLMSQDGGDLLGDQSLYSEVENFLDVVCKDEAIPSSDKLTTGLDLLGRYYSQTNQAEHRVGGTFCQYAIQQGQILNHLKAWVQSTDQKWEPWAADHLKFMGERTRQQYMLLARRSDIWPYVYLGKERLLHLINATKGMQGNDPAGTLLREFNLVHEPSSEVTVSSFKDDVDAALAVVRARNTGVITDFQKVRKLVEIGDVPDSRMIRDMAVIQKNGGSVDQFLDRRFMNQGEEDELLDPQRRIESFEKLASRMKSTINVILKHADLATKIDRDQVAALEAKIAQLKTFITAN